MPTAMSDLLRHCTASMLERNSGGRGARPWPLVLRDQLLWHDGRNRRSGHAMR